MTRKNLPKKIFLNQSFLTKLRILKKSQIPKKLVKKLFLTIYPELVYSEKPQNLHLYTMSYKGIHCIYR